MNLKIECQDVQFNLEGIKSLEELKFRIQQTQPSFVVESLTYQDEEKDIITLNDENDFKCLSTTSQLIIQVQGKFDQEQALKDLTRKQKLVERLDKKVKQYKEKQKSKLINRRDYYEGELTKVLQQKKVISENVKDLQSIKQQIEFQKKLNIINNKMQIRCVMQEAMMQYRICEFVKREEAEFTYDEENLEQFMNKIELLQQNLCERFFESYQSMRLNKLIEIKEKQFNGNENIFILSKQLYELEQIKEKQLFQFNLQENYYTSKLRDVKYLLENL